MGRLAAAAAFLVVGLSSARAADAPDPQAVLDLAQSKGWAETLAFCDLVSFLSTRPNLDADVVLWRDDSSGWLKPLYGPRFRPPNVVIDGQVRRALDRLERSGAVDRREVRRVRARMERRLLPAFRDPGPVEQHYLGRQRVACRARLDPVLASR